MLTMTRRTRRTYPDLVTYFRDSGETQAAFAKRIKRSQSYVSKVVNRHVEPNLSDALLIVRTANVPLESLMVRDRELSVA